VDEESQEFDEYYTETVGVVPEDEDFLARLLANPDPRIYEGASWHDWGYSDHVSHTSTI
jgi:hypothetical protein